MEEKDKQTEANDAFSNFDALVTAILKVPRSEIMRRDEIYRRASALNPHRRGPKPKPKDSTMASGSGGGA